MDINNDFYSYIFGKKDLKEAILRKHALAHTYNEPGVLLTSNYTANCGPEEASTKTFLTRMKAFETSKHLGI